jgi:hypothetical protein
LEPNGKIGKLRLQTGKPALVGDLSQLRGVSGLAIDGILGMSFLSTQVIHFDFDRGKIYFLKGAGTQGGDSFPLHFDPQGIPLVDIEVPAVGTRWFLLNTSQVGFVSGNLDRWTFADLAGKGVMTRVAEMRATSVNGSDVYRQGDVGHMSLRPISLSSLSLSESGRNELGLNFLMRFNVTFDFPGRRLYLTKSKRFGEPDRVVRCGMLVLREHGDTIVARISHGGPRKRAAFGLPT